VIDWWSERIGYVKRMWASFSVNGLCSMICSEKNCVALCDSAIDLIVTVSSAASFALASIFVFEKAYSLEFTFCVVIAKCHFLTM
jgi:hypothetical protein